MPRYPLLGDVEWLRGRYVVDRLSTTQIARLAGVANDNPSTVRRALVRHGIERRTISESRSRELLPPVTYTEKACTVCAETKPLTEFHLNKGMLDGRASQCKRCSAVNASATTARMRVRVIAALGGRCVWAGCGIDDVRVLTIDHRNGGGDKHRRSSTKGPYGYYKAMLDELDEFQVLCHNHQHLKRIEAGENRKPVGAERQPRL